MGYKVPLVAAVALNAATDGYFPLMNCQCSVNFTDEGSAETPFFEAGVLTNLFVTVWANASAGSTTVYLRKNGVNGNMSISIGAGLTGRFFDNTNTDTVSNGDVACTFVDKTGTTQIGLIGAYYETNSGVIVQKIGVSGSSNSASGTNYVGFIGGTDTVGDNNSATTPRISVAGTIKNFHAYSNANTRTNTTNIRTRLNGANGNCQVTFPASTTGLLTNSGSSDTLSISDNLNLVRVTNTGSGTFTLRHIGFEIHYPANEMNIFSADIGVVSFSATTARYAIPSGSYAARSSSGESDLRMYGSGIFSDMYINASANAATAAAVIHLFKNSATTSLTASFAIATAGTISDTSNTVSFANSDSFNYRYLKSTGSGATSIRWFSLKVTYDVVLPPVDDTAITWMKRRRRL